MTRTEFAARIKSKYPSYSSLNDDELVSKILAKYPDYASQIDDAAPAPPKGPPGPMGKYGGVPGNEANVEQNWMERAGQAMTQNVVDYGRAAFNAITGRQQDETGTLGGTMGRVGADIGIGAGKGIVDTGSKVASLLGADVSPDLNAAVQPDNGWQSAGQVMERTAEFVAPTGLVGAGAKTLGLGRVPTALADIAANAGSAYGLAKLHGENDETAKTDAAIAGAIPTIGYTLGAATKGLGKRVIDSFFPQTKAESKMRISRKATSRVLQDEQIRGLRGQTLVDNIDDTLNNLDEAIAQKVVASADAGGVGKGQGRVVLPKIENLFNRGRRVAAARTEGSASAFDDGLKSIQEESWRLSGGSGTLNAQTGSMNPAMNARQLNNLRKHVNNLLRNAPPGSETYRRTLIDTHRVIKSELERLAPGVKAELARVSELIGTKHNVQNRLAILEKREPITNTDMATTGLAGFLLGGQAGAAVGAANVARKTFQYTPGRMMVGRGLQTIGDAPGRYGMGAALGAMGLNGEQGAPSMQPEPQAPPTLPDPKEQAYFTASLPVVSQFDSGIEAAAKEANIDPLLLKALVIQESGTLGPSAKSGKGARGLTQVMPAALQDLGMQDHDMNDPEVQLLAGAKYLRRLLDNYNGNATLALAAYNAGMGRVNRAGGVPDIKETKAYVPRVLRFYAALGGTRDEAAMMPPLAN